MSKLTSRRSRRRKTSTPRLAGLLGVLTGLVAGAPAVARRRSSAGAATGSGAAASATANRPAPGAPPSEAPAAAEVTQDTYTCECGAEYRVSGQDRHRVYWPKDADASDPVLGQACPECERPLPHDHAAAS